MNTSVESIILTLVELGSRIFGMIEKVADIARTAQAEGRDLNAGELATVNAIYTTALQSLDATIAAKET